MLFIEKERNLYPGETLCLGLVRGAAFAEMLAGKYLKAAFFPSVRKRHRKFPQVKVPGKDWSIAGKPRQWVLRVWQERSMGVSVLASLV